MYFKVSEIHLITLSKKEKKEKRKKKISSYLKHSSTCIFLRKNGFEFLNETILSFVDIEISNKADSNPVISWKLSNYSLGNQRSLLCFLYSNTVCFLII